MNALLEHVERRNIMSLGIHISKRIGLVLIATLIAYALLAQPVYANIVIRTQAAADRAVASGAIRGIDVSHWQSDINWAAVATENVHYAMLRASFGMEPDTHFLRNAREAAAYGIQVGAYHYAKFTDRQTMIAEANYFLNLINQVELTYPVVLDIEANRGMNRNTLTAMCIEFMEILRAQGYEVMLYSYTYFIDTRLNLDMLAGYPMWVANYLHRPEIPHAMWQHTSSGRVNGIRGNVDINVAYSDLSTSRVTRVNHDISRSIKEELNRRYDADIPMEGLDMQQIRYWVVTGLQTELTGHGVEGIQISGVPDSATLGGISRVRFAQGETGGNITYLIQAKLFYSGMYTNPLSGIFDEHTVAALQRFQRSNRIIVTGMPDYDTLRLLLAW
jgi:lysozyme